MFIGSLAEDFLKGEDLTLLLTSFNLEKNKPSPSLNLCQRVNALSTSNDTNCKEIAL